MQTLYGRVAVVVAGSDGVGAAIARCFGELGASVVVNYASDQAGAERVVAKIVRSGGRAVAFRATWLTKRISAMPSVAPA